MCDKKFLKNDEKNECEWKKGEKQKRKVMIAFIVITIALVVLIVCDVLFLKSIILSIFSAVGIIIEILASIEKIKNNM